MKKIFTIVISLLLAFAMTTTASASTIASLVAAVGTDDDRTVTVTVTYNSPEEAQESTLLVVKKGVSIVTATADEIRYIDQKVVDGNTVTYYLKMAEGDRIGQYDLYVGGTAIDAPASTEINFDMDATTTIKFVNENGEEIASQIMVSSQIGDTITISKYAPQTITYGTSIYSKDSSNPSTFVASSSANNLTITYTYLSEKREQITVNGVSYDLVTDNLIYNGDMSKTTNDGTYTYVTGWQGGYVNKVHNPLSDRPYLYEGGGWRSTTDMHFIYTAATESDLAYVTTPAVTTMTSSEQYPFKSDASENYMAAVLTSWMKDASDVNTYLKAEAGKQYYMSFDIMATSVASWQNNVIGFTAVSVNGDTHANSIPGTNGDINTLTWVLDSSIGRGRYTTTANQWITLDNVATANSDGYFMFQLGWAFEWGQVSVRNFKIYEIEPSATNKDITVTYTVNGTTVDSKTQTINTSAVTKANFDEYYYRANGTNTLYYAAAQSISDSTTVEMTLLDNWGNLTTSDTVSTDTAVYKIVSGNLVPNGNFEYGMNGWYSRANSTPPESYSITTSDKPSSSTRAALSSGAGGATSTNSIKQAWDIEIGSTYYYSMWVKAGDQWHGLGQSDSPSTEGLDLVGNGGFGTDSTWVQKTGVFTATNEYLVFFEGWGSVGLADVELYKVEVDASQSAATTIKFIDSSDNSTEIATSVTVNGIIGSTIDLTDTNLVPEAITYSGNVYSKDSSNPESYTVVGNTDDVKITYTTDAITEIDVTSVTVIDGNSPVLPTTLGAKTGAGAATTVTVSSWDTSSLSVGTNTVYGTIDGLTIKAEATVTVLSKTFELNDATSTTAGSGNVLNFPVNLSDEFYMEFDFVSTNIANNWIYISADGALWGAGQIGIGTNNDTSGSLKAQPVDEILATTTAGTTYRMFIRGDASADTYDLTVYDVNAKTTVAAVTNRSFRAASDYINSINLCTNGGGEYTLSNIKVHSDTASVETYVVNAVSGTTTLDSFSGYTGSTDKLGYDDNAVYPNVKIPYFEGYVFKNKTVSGSVVTLNYEATEDVAFFDNVATDTTFVSLNMLGAHDAFTANVASGNKDAAGVAQGDSGSQGAMTGIGLNTSKAQSKDTLTMLNHGVRYFDIRLSRSDSDSTYLYIYTAPHTNGVFYTTHGYLGDEFRPILYTIAQWAKEHPGEIVVLDFQEMWDKTSSAGSSGDSVAQSWVDLNNLLTETGIYDYVTINNGTDLSAVTYGDLTNNGEKAGIVLFGRAVATDASVGSFILRGTTSTAFDGKMYSNYSFGDASVSSSSLAADYIQAQVDHAYSQTGTVNNMYRVMQAISSTSNLINQAGTDNTYITNAVQSNPTWLTTLPVIMVNDATVNTSDLLTILKACNVPVDVTMNYSTDGTTVDSGTAKLMVGTLYTGGVVGALYAGANGEYAVTEAVTGEVPVPYNGSITLTAEKLGNVYSTRIENNVHSVYSGNLDDDAVYAGKTNFAAYTWGQDNDRLGIAVLTAENGKEYYALSANVVRTNFNQDYRNVKFYVLPVSEYRALDLSDKDALLAKLTDDTLVATINPDNYGVGTREIALDATKIVAAAAKGDIVIIGNAQGGLYGIEGSSMAIVTGYNVTIGEETSVAYGSYTLPSGAVAYSDAETCKVYEPNEVVAITADTEFISYASLGINTINGAQVRIGEGVDENGKVSTGSGLRFITTINLTDTLATLSQEESVEMEFGVVITADGSDASVTIKAESWQDGDAKTVFTSALTNLAESNYNRKFTATPYITVDGKTFYGESVTRSIYQVAAGLLTKGYSDGDYGQSNDSTGTNYDSMPPVLINVLNAYVNQTGVRLTLSDNTEAGALTARTGDDSGAYTGDAFFTVGETTYADGKYTVTLTAVGNAKIDVDLFNEYVRINNNNSKVSPVTTITDNGDGTYKIVFNYADM